MKPAHRILILAAALCAAASAAPSTKTITIQQEVALYNAITALDQGGVKNADGKATAYAFDFSMHTRMALTHNLTAVTPAKMAAEKVQTKKTLELSGGKPVADNDPVFNAKLSMAMDTELSAADPNPPKLETISEADLKLDTNPIPLRVLSLLGPILTP